MAPTDSVCWNLGSRVEICEKVSGRLDSNQRPPAPKGVGSPWQVRVSSTRKSEAVALEIAQPRSSERSPRREARWPAAVPRAVAPLQSAQCDLSPLETTQPMAGPSDAARGLFRSQYPLTRRRAAPKRHDREHPGRLLAAFRSRVRGRRRDLHREETPPPPVTAHCR